MSFPPDSERPDLYTYAVRFSFRNLVRAFWNSPFSGPYPKIGRNLGTVVEVAGKQEQVDKIQPDAANEYGGSVIIFKQGKRE